jgi:serine/threonine protein kinase
MSLTDYTFGKAIGNGSYGVIHHVKNNKNNQDYVCKKILTTHKVIKYSLVCEITL